MNAIKTKSKDKTSAAKPRGTRNGGELIGAFQEELAARQRGEPAIARAAQIPDQPADYGAAEVLALRHRVGVTQRTFGRLMGVSMILVHSWERGKRRPSALARRLLDEIAANPGRWAAAAKE